MNLGATVSVFTEEDGMEIDQETCDELSPGQMFAWAQEKETSISRLSSQKLCLWHWVGRPHNLGHKYL